MSELEVFNPKFGPDQILPATNFKVSNADDAVNLDISKDGYSSAKPISVYTMFKSIVDDVPLHPALAVKREGNWKYWSYQDYFDESFIVAKAFLKLGLDQFHGVCIMGFNSPEWCIANFGAIFGGGLAAGIYTTNSPEACRHLAENCAAQIILVEDDLCLSKILSIKRFLPNLKAIVQWSGVPKAPGIISWAELLAIGQHEPDAPLLERLSLSAINQCCTLIYTSGTTGPPKGVMCSQDNLTWIADVYVKMFDLTKYADDAIISYLPLSHLAGQMTDLYFAMKRAATVYFAQPDSLKGSLGQTLVEVQPSGFLGVPRIWEKIYEKMQEAGASAGSLKKLVAGWAKFHGYNEYSAIKEGRELGTLEQLKVDVAKKFLINKVKNALGLGKANYFISGSAPISVEVLEYFMSLGMPITEGYGLSESLSLCSMSHYRHGEFKLGSVGKVIPQTIVKIIPAGEHREGVGEICIKGRNICMGYLKMPDKVDETIDDDRWLHTGDLGRIDDEGFLYITGRLKELVITAGGENIPPVLIEDSIKKELFCVSQAMLVGDKRKYLAILLTLKCEVNLDTAMPYDDLTPSCINWMEKSGGSSAKTVTQAREEIENNPNCPLARAIDAGIQRYNEIHAASNAQKVQKWTILDHDFSQPTNELNNTLKLKRSYVLEAYKDIIDAMYDREKSVNSRL